ncbi:MAG: DUF4384 domain-containing protein [Magnetococcales bacterium]|nr:DUF4384 domain-containing protein [Magnetococcales bacterium]
MWSRLLLLFFALALTGAAPIPDADDDYRALFVLVRGTAILSDTASDAEGNTLAGEAAHHTLTANVKQYIDHRYRVSGAASRIDYAVPELSDPMIQRVSLPSRAETGSMRSHQMELIAEIPYRLTSMESASQHTIGWPLTLRAWAPKRHFTQGEQITFHIQGNRPAFARIFDVPSEGDLIQLLPNAFRTFRQFKPGLLYRIPDASKGEEFTFDVYPPYGKETLLTIASDRPLGKVRYSNDAGEMFRQYRGTSRSLTTHFKHQLVENLKQDARKHSGETVEVAEYYQSTWTLSTGK